jgi:tRNA dimethylallyltransferase
MSNEVIVIAGPTASGKSAYALELARQRKSTIINADSLQLYGALPILTAQPRLESVAEVPHRLYGVLAIQEKASAALWAKLAAREIEHALAAGSTPILVGGTGLYLETLVNGIVSLPDIPVSIHIEAEEIFEELGAVEFHRRLIEEDPLAERLHAGDTQRVKRAWAVLRATGRSLFAWHSEPLPQEKPFSFRSFIILPPRETLYAACDTRFIAMLKAGAVDEVASYLEWGDAEAPVTRALGFKSLASYVQSKITYEKAVAEAQQLTRNYAKRQMTWFRNRRDKLKNVTTILSFDCLPDFNKEKG